MVPTTYVFVEKYEKIKTHGEKGAISGAMAYKCIFHSHIDVVFVFVEVLRPSQPILGHFVRGQFT